MTTRVSAHVLPTIVIMIVSTSTILLGIGPLSFFDVYATPLAPDDSAASLR